MCFYEQRNEDKAWPRRLDSIQCYTLSMIVTHLSAFLFHSRTQLVQLLVLWDCPLALPCCSKVQHAVWGGGLVHLACVLRVDYPWTLQGHSYAYQVDNSRREESSLEYGCSSDMLMIDKAWLCELNNHTLLRKWKY